MHPLVIEEAVSRSLDGGTSRLSGATSNQIGRSGGYPSTLPPDLRDLALDTAERIGSLEVARF